MMKNAMTPDVRIPPALAQHLDISDAPAALVPWCIKYYWERSGEYWDGHMRSFVRDMQPEALRARIESGDPMPIEQLAAGLRKDAVANAVGYLEGFAYESEEATAVMRNMTRNECQSLIAATCDVLDGEIARYRSQGVMSQNVDDMNFMRTQWTNDFLGEFHALAAERMEQTPSPWGRRASPSPEWWHDTAQRAAPLMQEIESHVHARMHATGMDMGVEHGWR